MNFVCPKCSRKLNINLSGNAVCEAGHSYDRSRFGYYNLLLSNAGGVHGDNREMIEARRDFLESGSYQPLADKLASLACEYTPFGGVLLDVGCGEGYYTEKVIDSLSNAEKNATVLAFDISKEAAKYSARRCKGATVAVASAYRMPVADGSVDIALNVFSPLAIEETKRILHSGSKFIMAIPDRMHLFGLKRILYKTPYENEPQDATLDGFKLLGCEKVSYTLKLSDGKTINSLFMMTPYAYRTPKEARERLAMLDSLETEIEFLVFVYERI